MKIGSIFLVCYKWEDKMKYIFKRLKLKELKQDDFKMFFSIIAFLSLLFLMVVIVVPRIHGNINSNEESGCTLPGAGKIYPAVMLNESIYNWDHMAGPITKLPEGQLPKGYEYVGDIEYTNTGKLNKDFQFIATFNATGQLYYNIHDSNNLCICITTYWLDNAYVIFSKK